MWEWKKIGLIFDPTAQLMRPNWRWEFAQGQNVLIFDSFVRIYICCREKLNEKGQTISRIGYVDLDKDDLTHIFRISDKNILELGKLGCFDEFGQYPFCPIKVDNLIYGYYGGVTRCESVPFTTSIGVAISKDKGKTFEKIGDGPILTCSLDEPIVIGSPKVRYFDGLWYMTYSAGVKWTVIDGKAEVYYKLRMATSHDGIEWEKLGRDIIPDKLGNEEAQACGDIIYKNDKYHMFFCYRKNEDFRRNKNNSYRIGYAWSNDLETWTRDDEKVGIDISRNEDEWDSEMIAYPNVFEVNNTIYMTYLGNEVGKYGFGLAKLEGELR